jgi:RNA polymerase sigma-70 factor (ECF subfamily)
MVDERRRHLPAHSTDSTSVSLLDRVKAQDSQAWQRLVDLYSPLLFSWCRRCGLGHEDAEDVVQQVFRSITRQIGQFRRERQGDTFRGWLRVIARNQICQYYRAEGRHPQAVGGTTARLQLQELPDESLGTDESNDVQDARDLFCRGLDLIRSEFEAHTWQAFWSLVVDGRASDDVCREFGMTSGALRQAKYKVLRKLRTELGDVLE